MDLGSTVHTTNTLGRELLTVELLALIGITLIVVRGTIFAPIRKLWPALLGCSQCAGVWVGVIAGAIGLMPLGHGRLQDTLLLGAATSFSAMLADAILLRLLGAPEE
jgi:hypothetical protein